MTISVWIAAAAMSISFTSCYSSNPQEKVRQDSLAESAAADSMLKAALKANALNSPKSQADSIQ